MFCRCQLQVQLGASTASVPAHAMRDECLQNTSPRRHLLSYQQSADWTLLAAAAETPHTQGLRLHSHWHKYTSNRSISQSISQSVYIALKILKVIRVALMSDQLKAVLNRCVFSLALKLVRDEADRT